jgi:hypothetical protein
VADRRNQGGNLLYELYRGGRPSLSRSLRPVEPPEEGERRVMTHKYRGSQQSSREVKPKFIDSTQGEPKDIYKP